MRTKTPRVFALITAGTLCIMLVSGFTIVYAANPPSGNVVPNFSALKVAGDTTIGGACTVNGLTVTGTSDLKGNVSNSTGDVTVNDNLRVNELLSALKALTVGTTATVTGLATLNGGARVSSGTAADDLILKGGTAASSDTGLIAGLKHLVLQAGSDIINLDTFAYAPARGTIILSSLADQGAFLGNSKASVHTYVSTGKGVSSIFGEVIRLAGIINTSGTTPNSDGTDMDAVSLKIADNVDISGSISNPYEDGLHAQLPVKIDDDLNLTGKLLSNLTVGKSDDLKNIYFYANKFVLANGSDGGAFTPDFKSVSYNGDNFNVSGSSGNHIKFNVYDADSTFQGPVDIDGDVTIHNNVGPKKLIVDGSIEAGDVTVKNLDIQTGILKRNGNDYMKTVSYEDDLVVKGDSSLHEIQMHCGDDEIPVYCNFYSSLPKLTIPSRVVIDPSSDVNGCKANAKNTSGVNLSVLGALSCIKK
ncbi:MAG: hypothetical protein US89_C0005G0036 [Candidatus Peregrinibacteria bacterium GW2011_GWF2_38_29]|nr:MAG: hypothetical protein US89_C0005G0036 [Candidatus Peregrinibacteria bacterium GW2011_GWF2_38_29]HBB02623.1 hypothetical protein [Candidatus Peregrinibacteria bacterium]